MHRDLKPENIMFKAKNNIDSLVITDFGLSEFENCQPFLFTKCGTPGFIAPEIANFQIKSNDCYNSLCDVFSAGAVFHRLYLYMCYFLFFFKENSNLEFYKSLFSKKMIQIKFSLIIRNAILIFLTKCTHDCQKIHWI